MDGLTKFKIRRVLITVADGSEKKVVDCAAQIVAKSKAKIELFSVVRSPPPVLGMTRVDDPQITRSYVSRRPREQADLHDYRHPGWRINASI